jgi:SAM-dependent methyltransferase
MKQTVYEKKPVNCPLCDCDQTKVFMDPWVDVEDPVKLYGAASGIKGTQRLVTCVPCGMIYENPRFPEKAILKGYESANEAGHDSQFEMRVQSFERALISLKKKIPGPGSKILDIGTAGGAFLEAATRYGYEAYGLEPSAYLVEQGKLRGLKIELGTIAQNPLPKQSFDMICLWDVIEHLTDPKQALTQIRKLLKPDGILLINYPDIGTLQAKLAGKNFWWILSVHLHHFNRQTLGDICRRTGYEVVHFQKYWQTLQFGYLQQVAIHLKVPFIKFFARLTPGLIKKTPLPHYASQTTAIAKVKP